MQSTTLSNFYRFDLVDNVESKYPASTLHDNFQSRDALAPALLCHGTTAECFF